MLINLKYDRTDDNRTYNEQGRQYSKCCEEVIAPIVFEIDKGENDKVYDENPENRLRFNCLTYQGNPASYDPK